MALNDTLLAERVNQQAIEHIFRQMPPLWLGAMLVGGLFVAGLWSEFDAAALLLWFLAYSIALGNRFYLTVLYFSASSLQRPPEEWGRLLTRAGLYQGVIWGAATFFFINPASIANQVLVLCIVMALPISALPISGYWISSFYSFTLSSSGMLAMRMFMVGDREHLVIALSLLVYLLVILLVGWGVGRSLREGVRLRFENQELIEELSLANQTKSRFLAAASHDLRQPVHSLALFHEALAPEVISERGKVLLNNINMTLESHNSLLNSLLDISKLDAGVIEAREERVPIRALLENLYREMRPKAEQKGLQFYVRACSHEVMSDATLLMNILRNLIGNAINYTREGWVMVACRRRGGQLLLQVWDSGCGIPASQQETIFEEFHQLSNPERDRSKGLGLGLAICRRLAAILSHDLSVLSREGKGSVFTLTLPMVAAETEPREEAVQPTPPPSWQLAGRTVLVIDDEKSVLEGMASVLSGWGCQVLLADSVEAAVARAAEGKVIDAIISDYRLREGATGVEAINAVNAQSASRIPAMLVTGDTDPLCLQEAKQSGFVLLHKPVSPAHLRGVLGQLLAAPVTTGGAN